jgi:endonuclease/exonuclease/phosphatase family metal-dependent hydrolase
VNIRVASFNLQSATLDRSRGQQRPWRKRRAKVVRQIRNQRVDVIGVQEAAYTPSFRNRLVSGATQYLDLRNGLNSSGGRYALTSRAAVNCRRAFVNYRCKRRDRDASAAERILYNRRTLSLVRRNAMKYSRQSAASPNMYLAWAVLRSKKSGDRFLFTTTHLDPHRRAVRKAQWRQMIRKVKQIRNGMPVVSVGDFNVHKFDPMARTMLPAMRRAHIGDVLNQQYKVNPSRHVRARSRSNAWLSTLNRLSRNVRRFGYEDARRKTGNGIDYIFASNRLTVLQYKVVCRFNRRTLRVRGILPSDHNMIRATIRLP